MDRDATPSGSLTDGSDDDAAGRLPARLQAMIQVGRHHGIELNPEDFRGSEADFEASAAALSLWAQNAGMWARAVRIRWRHLLQMQETAPAILLFTDGTAGLLTGADPAQKIVFLRDPYAPATTAPVPLDEGRVSEVWAGEAVLVRANRGETVSDAPFNLGWLARLVLTERRAMRDIAIGSFTMSILTIFPPFLVMATINRVLQFQSVSTLVLISALLVTVVAYETILGYARRLIVAVLGVRLDTKINLFIFQRVLRLPLDYFERHPAGETMHRIGQVSHVREFLTGTLLTTILDLVTLAVLLPFLFYLSPSLGMIVFGMALLISLIILAYLSPLRASFSRIISAEVWKSAAITESVFGIKTVKVLALEPQRRALWDERVAEAGQRRLEFARLANWPQTLVTPLERMMVLGTVLVGAYEAISEPTAYQVGVLFAFFMLAGRVAQPLVGLARLMENYQEVRCAIAEAGSVLNRPPETDPASGGLRPRFAGDIALDDVSFTYAGTHMPALDRMTASIPAGAMVGVVGRSGSGKSTLTRLLQGINRDYSGFIKIDGIDLREMNLRHLRRSLGVVLQDNFLFRGTIRDNIIAGRPGLTLTDAVRAARLAGAEEFIERMPNGYETYVEEGSPNLSGGQRQRLAIARALIHDPRILILDEATSALDPESEAVVSANLNRIARGRTMIMVSHRLSFLTGCDQIMVLDAGRIVDMAPHAALLERCAIYRHLWQQQNAHLHGRDEPPAMQKLVLSD